MEQSYTKLDAQGRIAIQGQLMLGDHSVNSVLEQH